MRPGMGKLDFWFQKWQARYTSYEAVDSQLRETLPCLVTLAICQMQAQLPPSGTLQTGDTRGRPQGQVGTWGILGAPRLCQQHHRDGFSWWQ